MSLMKMGALGFTFKQPELSVTIFKLSGASIALNGDGTATVTLASHLRTAGDLVTFSGSTGVSGFNGNTYTVLSVTNSGVYVIACSLTGTLGGTIVQEPVVNLPIGMNFIITGANAVVEYNPDNSYNSTTSQGTGQTWRQLIAASAAGCVASDGTGVRLRCSGTTATTTVATML